MASLTERCYPFAPYGGLAVAASSHDLARSLGTACVPQLEIVLEHGSSAMRAFAVEALAKLEPHLADARATSVLERESDVEVRSAAIRSLGRSQSEDVLERLLAMLVGTSFAVREAAADALVGRGDARAAERVLETFGRLAPDAPARNLVAGVLGRMSDASARARVLSLIDEGDGAALEAVRAAGADATVLWRAFESKVPALQSYAAKELAGLADQKNDPRLLKAFEPSFAPTLAWEHLRATSQAVLGSDPALAFETLAPYLDPSILLDKFSVDRARAITMMLYDDIGDTCSAEEPPSVLLSAARRWRPALERLCDVSSIDDWVRDDAKRALAALRWADGERDRLVGVNVDLGEDADEPFPFLIVGWSWARGERSLDDDARASLAHAGIHTFQHQIAGYACRQADLCGYAMLLPEKLREAARASAAGFETWGDPLSPGELAEWSGALSSLGFPPFESGYEALIESKPLGTMRDFLRGLEVVRFRARARPWEGIHYYGDPPDIDVVGAFDEVRDTALDAIGATLALGPPRVALVWGNSD